MKKITFILFVFLTVILSCDKPSKAVQNTNVKSTDTVQSIKKDGMQMAQKDSSKMAAVYQCPMNCEKGKTYNKPGKCPKCKMDLVKK